MSTAQTRPIVSLALATFLACLGAPATAQDPSPKVKDDALDNMLRNLDGPKPAAPPGVVPSPPKPPDDPKPAAAKPPAGDAPPRGGVTTNDKDLDSFLEKLGETTDKPAAADEKTPGGPGAPKPDEKTPGGGPGHEDQKRDPAAPEGKDRKTDAHLEELSGKRRKPAGRQDRDGGPMSDVIKEMRDVEGRLGEPDTGQETRKKQGQIVKRLDTLIEQMKSSAGQKKGKKQLVMKPGDQSGPPQNGETPGTTGGNASTARPLKPTDRKSLAGGQGAWGHLQAEDRQAVDNVSSDALLPTREELIRRYYLTVTKKSASRGSSQP